MAKKKKRKKTTLPPRQKQKAGKLPELSPERPEEAIAWLLALPDAASPETLASLPAEIQSLIPTLKEAFACFCRGEYEAALAAVKEIGHNSPAAPWRLLLKGLCAYYRGEDEKALAALRRLPENSPTTRIAEPWLYLLRDPETIERQKRNQEFLKQVCNLTGADEVAHFLPRCEVLWLTGRKREALLKAGIYLNKTTPAHPAHQIRLLRLFGNGVFSLSPSKQIEYLHKLGILLQNKLKKTGPLWLEYRRITAIYAEQVGEFSNSIELWEAFIDEGECLIGQFAKPIVAAIRAHQAQLLIRACEEHDPDNFFGFAPPQSPFDKDEIDEIDELYQQALELDPDNLEIATGLIEFLQKAGRPAQARLNRLLDRLSQDFPENPRFLALAGTRCIERKAYKKGLKYLRQALQADPVNPDIRTSLIIGNLMLIRQMFRDGRDQKALQIFTELQELSLPGRHDLVLSPATLKVREIVFRKLAGEIPIWEPLPNEVSNSDPSFSANEIQFFYISYLATICGHMRIHTRLSKEFHLLHQSADFSDLLNFIEIFEYIWRIDSPQDPILLQEECYILGSFLIKKSSPQTTPEEFIRILKFLEDSQAVDALQELQDDPYSQLESQLLRKAREIHPRNLELKIYDLLSLIKIEPSRHREFLTGLEEVHSEANAAGNEKLAEQIAELIESYGFFRFLNEVEGGMIEAFEEESLPLPPGVRQPPKNWPRRRRRG